MPTHHHSSRLIPWLVAGALLAAVPAMAEDSAPVKGPDTIEAGPDASAQLGVPRVSPVAKPMPAAPSVLRWTLPSADGDKGSAFTDAGFGAMPAAPTEFERMKLERARAAIEASRAAGILFRFALPTPPEQLSPEEVELAKLRDLERMAQEKRVPGGDPIAAPGSTPQSLQVVGPQGLSELEQRKLDALRSGAEFKEAPISSAKKTEEARPKIDAGRKDGKDGR